MTSTSPKPTWLTGCCGTNQVKLNDENVDEWHTPSTERKRAVPDVAAAVVAHSSCAGLDNIQNQQEQAW